MPKLVILLLAKLADIKSLVVYVALQSWLNTIERMLFPTESEVLLYTWDSSSYLCSAHSQSDWSVAWLVMDQNKHEMLRSILLYWKLKRFHFTLSTATNPLTTLNKVIASGVLTCLIFELYLFEFRWRIVEGFTSNAEYAMLIVYVLMIKWIWNVMHTDFFCLFICCVMCYVYLI